MKLNSMKKIGLLAAVMLIAFSIVAVAACPPGSLRMTPNGIEGVGAAGTPPLFAAAHDLAEGRLTLLDNRTYCVEADIQLQVDAGWVGANATECIILGANTRIVGAHPGVRVTGSLLGVAGAFDPVFRIDASGAELQGFSIYKSAIAAGVETHGILVQPAGSDSVIRDMTIVDTVRPALGFTNSFIEIAGGLNVTVQGTTLRNVFVPGAAPFAVLGISVTGGNNHRIVDGIVHVNGAPLFTAINVVGGNGHEILRNTINNTVVLADPDPAVAPGQLAVVNQIFVGTTNTTASANVINLTGGITALLAGVAGDTIQVIGINVANAMITVTNNTIRNTGPIVRNAADVAGGALVGINVDGAGTNAIVEGNRVTGCGTSEPARVLFLAAPNSGDAILVGAANVRVANNPALQVGTAIAPVITDMATGVRVLGRASNVQVLNNPNINSATSGILVIAPNTTVRGNTITDSCTGAVVSTLPVGVIPGGIVVAAPGSAGAPIENNTVMNVSQGNINVVGSGSGIVLIAGSSNQYILNNTVSSTYRHGIEVADPGSVSNQIIGNTVTNAGMNGFNVEVAASNTLVQGNTFRSCRNSGVFVNNNALNTQILNNTLENNGGAGSPPVAPTISEALVISGGSNNSQVRGNTIITNVLLPENRGIRVEACMNVIVDGNTIKNTSPTTLTHGIFIETGTTNSTFSNNIIEHMQEYGIVIRGGSGTLGSVNVTGNTLNNNAIGILFDGGASNVTCNLITGGSDGIRINAGVAVNNHTFIQNAIYSPIRARNLGISTFNAQGNYWGDPAGPPAKTVFGPVDTSNWLTSHPACAPTPPVAPPPAGLNHTYGAAAGWYMVSCPLNSGSASDLFGATAYTYNPTTGKYDVVTTIEPTKGYWVTLQANKSVTDTGDQVTSDVTLAISTTGWYQISAPWSYPKSAIQVIKSGESKSWADAVTAGWIRNDIYGYTATGADYTTPSTLNPWYGYWVKAEVSGLSLKLLVASGTPVSKAYAPMAAPLAFAPTDLPPMPPTFTPSAATLSFGNSPNPVVDVNTTYFEVKGAAAYLVEALKVQIYDLSGRLVYEAEEAGASLAWHTDNIDGEYLANGVYLYKLYALLDGQWVVSTVKNVVILR